MSSRFYLKNLGCRLGLKFQSLLTLKCWAQLGCFCIMMAANYSRIRKVLNKFWSPYVWRGPRSKQDNSISMPSQFGIEMPSQFGSVPTTQLHAPTIISTPFLSSGSHPALFRIRFQSRYPQFMPFPENISHIYLALIYDVKISGISLIIVWWDIPFWNKLSNRYLWVLCNLSLQDTVVTVPQYPYMLDDPLDHWSVAVVCQPSAVIHVPSAAAGEGQAVSEKNQ